MSACLKVDRRYDPRRAPCGCCARCRPVAHLSGTHMPASTRRRTVRPIWFSETNVDELARLGFTGVSDICPPSDLLILRSELTRLFSTGAGRREGKYYDMVGANSDQAATLPTLLNPSNYAPELKRLECLSRTAQIARWLLGEDAVLNLEHAILKPAEYGAPTPWHQDEAYRREPDFRYNQVSFWIPLHDATDESGCLRFVSGSNLGEVLAHRSYQNDAGLYALECHEPIDAQRVTVLPVKAGDCSAHTGRTLHGAGPNRTARHRHAYILEYEAPPVPLRKNREFPWHRNRNPPSRAARSQWLLRGGIFVEAFRRFRDGLFRPRAPAIRMAALAAGAEKSLSVGPVRHSEVRPPAHPAAACWVRSPSHRSTAGSRPPAPETPVPPRCRWCRTHQCLRPHRRTP